MSCSSPLTTGFPLDCADGYSGISRILITNAENVSAFTEAAGTISAITMTTSQVFFEYALEEEDADFVSTENKSVQNGTLFIETVLNFTINKMTAAKSEELRLMAAARNLIVIVELANGDLNGIGFDKVNGLPGGAKKIGGTNQATSGKAFGDASGYTVGITSRESHYPYFIDASVDPFGTLV